MAMLIGITGGIGSGKTTIAKGLQALGYAVYFTDTEAKRLLQADAELIAKVKRLLGEEAYEGTMYNTAYVAQKVFCNAHLLQQLNALVHPAVRKDLQVWAARQNDVCFVESAILFESGLYENCAAVIAVTAPEEIRMARAMQRDHANADKIRQRMAAQLPDNELETRADFFVNNDGRQTISSLCLQIQDFCRTFAR